MVVVMIGAEVTAVVVALAITEVHAARVDVEGKEEEEEEAVMKGVAVVTLLAEIIGSVVIVELCIAIAEKEEEVVEA